MVPHTCILLLCLIFSSCVGAISFLNLTLPHQHPNPDFVAQEVRRRVNESISRRRQILESPLSKAQSQCLTGNPIDDCWRCDSNWATNRQRLADCAIGFGQAAMGGKGGRFYVVTDSSDHDTVNPTPGTLRHAVIQDEPLWIIFKSNMVIKLKHELIVNNYKTIDGRGANVQITGNGCITLQYVSNIIIHNVHVYNCMPSGNTNIRSSPTHVGMRGKSDGDGISIFGSRNIWIDHCTLSHCTDGLVDIIMASTAITVSNNYFSNHNEVMLLGHDDKFSPDSGMQVTIALNRFGEGLVQRMPRIRRGYVHVVNNDYIEWKMYAIGGSAGPTVNSEGNRFTASTDPSAKEVTRRELASEGEWADWNWRTDGDIMMNGAFFVPSGEGATMQYAKASSVNAKSANQIDQLTMNAGVLGGPRYTHTHTDTNMPSLNVCIYIYLLHSSRISFHQCTYIEGALYYKIQDMIWIDNVKSRICDLCFSFTFPFQAMLVALQLFTQCHVGGGNSMIPLVTFSGQFCILAQVRARLDNIFTKIA